MKLQKAKRDQYSAVRAFYHAVIDGIGDSRDSVGWKKDVYPAPDFLRDSIAAGEIYVAVDGGEIIGAMVLNHRYNEEYRKYAWPTRAADAEVTVIHALAVHPAHRGKGCAKEMVRFAVDRARENRQRAIRLDVLQRNRPARALYSGMGFRYCHTLRMFYEDVGWAAFDLYEYPLEQKAWEDAEHV